MFIKPDHINKIESQKAQDIVDQWYTTGAWNALELEFGKDKVYVVVYGKGPTEHIESVGKLLQSAIDAVAISE